MNLINEQSVATSTCTSIKELSPSAQVLRGVRSLLSSPSTFLESESAASNGTKKITTTKTAEYLASPTSSFSFASSSSMSTSTMIESAALNFSTLVRSSPAAVESINRQIEKKISNKISFNDAADQINLISKMPATTAKTINCTYKSPSSSSMSSTPTSVASNSARMIVPVSVPPPPSATTTTTITGLTKKINIENVCCSDVSNCLKSNTNCDSVKIDNTIKKTPEKERKIGCEHYKRRAMFVTPCCNKFYKCRYCHDENETHHFDRKTLTELICVECNTRQKVQQQCEKCGVRFGKYTCLICNLFDDEDKNQYHCHGCGICRIGGRDNFFHCETCNMCLPIELKIEGHRCVENISRSNCPVCLGAIHTSRIPCHIPDCGHLLHKMCFDQLLASGHYVCPTCQTSLLDMTKMWEYLDTQALIMTMPKQYENQRVYIFCNDCHDTCKTKFHFVGLKCTHCGGYNTTQDIKRRMSWANVDSSTSA